MSLSYSHTGIPFLLLYDNISHVSMPAGVCIFKFLLVSIPAQHIALQGHINKCQVNNSSGHLQYVWAWSV